MLPVLLALAAAAPPEGYVEEKQAEGCVLYKGPAERDGVQPMRAECHWPKVRPEALAEALSDYEAYDELIFAITDSRVIQRDEDGSALVHQVQVTKGIAPREVVLRMRTEVRDDATRVSWKSETVKMELVTGHVVAPRNDGAWEVGPHPEGGSRVVHEIAYDPGGNVPGWVVRWFQVGGMLQVMKEVRAVGQDLSAR